MYAAPAGAQANPRIAYGSLTGSGGRWHYRANSPITPDEVTSKVLASGARFVKVSQQVPPDAEMAPYFDQLNAAGLSLGVRLNVRPPATVDSLLAQGAQLRASGYFGWIFLDGAQKQPDIQQVVTGLESPDGGAWPRVATNDTGWQVGSPLAHGQWLHTHLFRILKRQRVDKIEQLVEQGAPLIRYRDRQFIRAVHRDDPNSLPVLKFEVHSQTDVLRQLPPAIQRELLSELAADQAKYHFTMIFPLFVAPLARPDGRAQCQPVCATYNSVAEHTYALQRTLLHNK